jgi:HAD superfamily hydrolase (TIGR01509 family)
LTAQPRFRAVIFDMDGVVTDSEPAFYAAVNDLLGRYGHHIDADEYAEFIGSSTPDLWRELMARRKLPARLDEMLVAYEEPLMPRLREPRPPLPGARELITGLRRSRLPVALCTASYMRWVDAILAGAGLTGMFDVLSTADMVPVTKPDPAPYLLAAQKLGMPPGECIAVEDSVNGVTSAVRAGTHVVQLRATATAAAPVDGVALVIKSLADFPVSLVSTD